jgi:predicted RNA-binding Zn-ribbon protein involved in translation (DUF1610 family)
MDAGCMNKGALSLGAALSARCKTELKTCPMCGEAFIARTRAICCSNRCRQRRFKLNKKGA